ncbi:MAG: hypothetical protein ACRDHU_09540 [Actinomycetota bacterium]
MSTRIRTSRRVAMSIVAMTTATIWLARGLSASADPPGNNGTVKVAGEDLSSGNDTHVGCAFTIDFSGYDEGDLYAEFVIEGQSPTENGTFWAAGVFIGEDPAGGGTDLDASAAIDLADAFSGPPHDGQGYHVKLTVHADGAQGADTKHKTFWVDCVSDGEGEGEGEESS